MPNGPGGLGPGDLASELDIGVFGLAGVFPPGSIESYQLDPAVTAIFPASELALMGGTPRVAQLAKAGGDDVGLFDKIMGGVSTVFETVSGVVETATAGAEQIIESLPPQIAEAVRTRIGAETAKVTEKIAGTAPTPAPAGQESGEVIQALADALAQAQEASVQSTGTTQAGVGALPVAGVVAAGAASELVGRGLEELAKLALPKAAEVALGLTPAKPKRKKKRRKAPAYRHVHRAHTHKVRHRHGPARNSMKPKKRAPRRRLTRAQAAFKRAARAHGGKIPKGHRILPAHH